MVAIVVAGYAVALRAGHWPPSHPWSGLTLVGLAAIRCRAGSPTEYRFRALQLGGAVVAGCARRVVAGVGVRPLPADSARDTLAAPYSSRRRYNSRMRIRRPRCPWLPSTLVVLAVLGAGCSKVSAPGGPPNPSSAPTADEARTFLTGANDSPVEARHRGVSSRLGRAELHHRRHGGARFARPRRPSPMRPRSTRRRRSASTRSICRPTCGASSISSRFRWSSPHRRIPKRPKSSPASSRGCAAPMARGAGAWIRRSPRSATTSTT